MAFPSIVGVSEFFQTAGSSASWAVPYPTVSGGILANDILICRASIDSPANTASLPGSWTTISNNDAVPATITARAGIGWIRCAGGESGTFTVTLGVAERGTAQVLCIRGAHTTSAPEFSANTNGNSTNPDPASLTASWGAEDNLWIPFGTTDGATTPSAAPANYSGLDVALGDASGASTWHAYRQLNAATEDAGVFTQVTEQWCMRSIVVRPAPGGPTYNDSGSGNLVLSGTRVESAAHDGSRSGSLVLSGSAVESHERSVGVTGTLTLTGSGVGEGGGSAAPGGWIGRRRRHGSVG